MKISCISTVLNEGHSIMAFLDSILRQTEAPDEIIIVDAGSDDNTYKILVRYKSIFKKKKISYAVHIHKGNRSVGRNYAIRKAQHHIIAVSDAGCLLDNNWIKKIRQAFLSDKKVDVVAGYYRLPDDQTIFQKALFTYTGVMPDKVHDDFLPSSRSVAFKRSVWEEVGGYPEWLDTCEDLYFAKKLKERGKKYAVEKDAIVFWPQKTNIFEAYGQFFKYAVGDGKALYIRPQTPLLFARYGIGGLLLLYAYQNRIPFNVIFLLLILYCAWAIAKNYRYVPYPHAFFYLPLLQITSDIAVMLGMARGFMMRFLSNNSYNRTVTIRGL